MYKTRQQFPSFMGVYIPPCSNVQSSINICICYITTVCTMKVLAIADTDVTALVTCLRGVCRRDGDNLNASQLAFIFEEKSELIEIPRVASPSERFVTFLGVHTPTDIFQILNGNAFVLFLCLCNELFAYTMVHNGGKSSLTSFQPFQQLMAVASAFGLDRSSHFIVSIAYILDFIRGYISPVRQGDNIGYTHIHSKKILRCLFFFVWNVYRLIEVEFSFDKNKISFSLCELHELWTIASICHLLTPINKRNGADTSLGIVGKYTTVIRDSSEFTETSLFFSVEFVCVGNLADCTYNKLGGKAVCPLDWMVNLLVQTELIEHTTFPCYLRDSVTSLIKNAKCLFQHYGLLVRWNQFYLQSQFHVTKIWKITKLFKCLKKIILLSLTKEGIVAQFLPEAKDLGVSSGCFFMKNKDFKKALESDRPINSMFALIPEKQKKAFMKFAKKFGFTEEKINSILQSEK